MPHYIYEIPKGNAAIRQISAFGDYAEASAFAREERQRRDFHDHSLVIVVHAETSEAAEAAAQKLQDDFEEARQNRPAPVARVSRFIRDYPAEDLDLPPRR